MRVKVFDKLRPYLEDAIECARALQQPVCLKKPLYKMYSGLYIIEVRKISKDGKKAPEWAIMFAYPNNINPGVMASIEAFLKEACVPYQTHANSNSQARRLHIFTR